VTERTVLRAAAMDSEFKLRNIDGFDGTDCSSQSRFCVLRAFYDARPGLRFVTLHHSLFLRS
jgi:hypothetical protein